MAEVLPIAAACRVEVTTQTNVRIGCGSCVNAKVLQYSGSRAIDAALATTSILAETNGASGDNAIPFRVEVALTTQLNNMRPLTTGYEVEVTPACPPQPVCEQNIPGIARVVEGLLEEFATDRR